MTYTIEGDRAEFRIDLSVIGLSAIKKAAHKFGGICDVSALTTDGTFALLSLTMRPAANPNQKATTTDALAVSFNRELLDCDLRDEIARQTEPLRNLLLAEAFSKTSLLAHQYETADYRNDPLGISAPSHRTDVT